MNKYGYTETRRIDTAKLRATCIKENWFDAGTNGDYDELFCKAYDLDNVTTDDLVELATMICEHTDGISALDDDEFCNVMYILAKEACYTYFLLDE